MEEIKRRDAEIERGEVQLIPAEAVMRRAYDALKGEQEVARQVRGALHQAARRVICPNLLPSFLRDSSRS